MELVNIEIETVPPTNIWSVQKCCTDGTFERYDFMVISVAILLNALELFLAAIQGQLDLFNSTGTVLVIIFVMAASSLQT